MKRIKLFVLALGLGLVANFAFANPNGGDSEKVILNVEAVGNKKVKVHLSNLQKITTNVVLTNLDGEIIFQEKIRDHNGYGKNLSLKRLPKGRYILSITQKDADPWQSVVLLQDNEVKVSRVTH